MKRIAAGFGLLVIVISTSSMNANAEDCPSGHKAHSEQKAAGILDFDKPAFLSRGHFVAEQREKPRPGETGA